MVWFNLLVMPFNVVVQSNVVVTSAHSQTKSFIKSNLYSKRRNYRIYPKISTSIWKDNPNYLPKNGLDRSYSRNWLKI